MAKSGKATSVSRAGKTSNMKDRHRRASRQSDTLDFYMRSIGNFPVLSVEEERILARRVREGGDPVAREKLIKANLRFVVSVAKQYQNQGIDLEDLINEGNFGLAKAAKRFDERLGYKFISYAVWWIRQAILAALAEQSRIVHIPLNRVGVILKINKVFGAIEQREGHTPSAEEIADELDLSLEEIQYTAQIPNSHLSLDAPFAAAEDSTFMEVLADENVASPHDEIVEQALVETVNDCLSELSPKQEEVIRLWTGLNDDKRRFTLEEIGIRYGLTRERVRQIKEKAIKRLRHGSRGRRLKAFYFND